MIDRDEVMAIAVIKTFFFVLSDYNSGSSVSWINIRASQHVGSSLE